MTRDDARKAAHKWWQELQEDRAARARLTRSSVQDALGEESVFRLCRALRFGSAELPRVAALACVLAKVREDEGRRFGQQVGRKTFDDESSAALSELRFKALLKARTDEEIARALRRAVLMLGQKANVRDLAHLILNWEQDDVRARLAFDYYAAGDAAPDPNSEPPQQETAP